MVAKQRSRYLYVLTVTTKWFYIKTSGPVRVVESVELSLADRKVVSH